MIVCFLLFIFGFAVASFISEDREFSENENRYLQQAPEFSWKKLEKGHGRFLRTISNYSYEVFLVHHIIIYFITPRAIPYMRGMVGVLGLFLVELLLMAVLGFLLKFISDQCIAALSNLTAVENKR